MKQALIINEVTTLVFVKFRDDTKINLINNENLKNKTYYIKPNESNSQMSALLTKC